MKKSEFAIGKEFYTRSGRWRCTDIGSRVVVAIPISIPFEVITFDGRKTSRIMAHDKSWFDGPPYAVSERVFDEDDMTECCRHQIDRSPASELWG